MSHRERCMSGVFSRILGHLGLNKDTQAPAKVSSEPQPLPILDSLPTQVQTCEIPPSSNQKSCEPTHIGTFNVVFNRDVSPAEKVAEKKVPAGFRVRVSVPAYHEPFTPVVIECTPGSGGVQPPCQLGIACYKSKDGPHNSKLDTNGKIYGLQWYSEKLMVDEDGDVAQEFLDEVISQASGPHVGYTRLLPSFKLKLKTRPAKLKGPVCTYDGNVVQTVEPFTNTKQKS